MFCPESGGVSCAAAPKHARTSDPDMSIQSLLLSSPSSGAAAFELSCRCRSGTAALVRGRSHSRCWCCLVASAAATVIHGESATACRPRRSGGAAAAHAVEGEARQRSHARGKAAACRGTCLARRSRSIRLRCGVRGDCGLGRETEERQEAKKERTRKEHRFHTGGRYARAYREGEGRVRLGVACEGPEGRG